ncbi:MAG TPA: helix-turn-helix domain-containing protein [Candidatus Limnocylindrales bacterium]
MSRIAEGSAPASERPYRSVLRAHQAERTRAAILEAAVRVSARGIATISIPDIAREAGVSIPTVYRHFSTKQDLLDAIYPYLERRAGRGALVVPAHIDELRDGVLRIVDQLDSFDALARASMASPAAEEGRHRSMPRRLALVGTMVDTIEPPLPTRARDRLVRLIVILTSSQSLRTWTDHLGMSPDEVADEIEAIVQAAIAAAREPQP